VLVFPTPPQFSRIVVLIYDFKPQFIHRELSQEECLSSIGKCDLSNEQLWCIIVDDALRLPGYTGGLQAK
jgi:hypothetical protein